MNADDLIERLATNLRPVRPLPSPLRRVGYWMAVSLPAVAAIILLMSPRPDLGDKLGDVRFMIEQGAAMATAIAAAYAAFATGVPGRSRMIIFLPLAPLAVWLATLGQGCVAAWLRYGPDGLALAPDWVCFPAIVMTGAVPGAVMVAMIRRGLPLAPGITMALAALAAGALANVGLRLFHAQDASLMVLVWQFGAVALLSAIGGMAGPRLLGHRFHSAWVRS